MGFCIHPHEHPPTSVVGGCFSVSPGGDSRCCSTSTSPSPFSVIYNGASDIRGIRRVEDPDDRLWIGAEGVVYGTA